MNDLQNVIYQAVQTNATSVTVRGVTVDQRDLNAVRQAADESQSSQSGFNRDEIEYYEAGQLADWIENAE